MILKLLFILQKSRYFLKISTKYICFALIKHKEKAYNNVLDSNKFKQFLLPIWNKVILTDVVDF